MIRGLIPGLWSQSPEPELGILSGAGAQIKNQKPELSLKFRTGAGAMNILEVAGAPFLDINVLAN